MFEAGLCTDVDGPGSAVKVAGLIDAVDFGCAPGSDGLLAGSGVSEAPLAL